MLNMTSGVDFLAMVTPCNTPSRYAQNDKRCAVIASWCFSFEIFALFYLKI